MQHHRSGSESRPSFDIMPPASQVAWRSGSPPGHRFALLRLWER